MYQESIPKKNCLYFTGSVLLLIIAISALYFLFLSLQQKNSQHLLVLTKQEAIRGMMEALTEQIRHQYQGRIQSFAQSKEELITAFAARDRERLLALSQPVFTVLQKENPFFASMAYILPDNSTFLRVHMPDFFDDDISLVRPAIAAANRSHMQIDGFEAGFGGLHYRIVQPLYYEGRYIGLVQFGISVEMFLAKLREGKGLHAACMLNHQEASKIISLRVQGKQTEGGIALLSGGDPLFNDLDIDSLQARDGQIIERNGIPYRFFTVTQIQDNDGRPLGSMLGALDFSDIQRNTRQLLFWSLVFFAAVIFLSALVLRRLFCFLFGRIESLHQDVVRKNTQLEAAQKDLQEQIYQRTQELEDSNRELNDQMIKGNVLQFPQQSALEEWQHTFNAITQPVLILDMERTILKENAAALEQFSSDGQTLVGRKCYEALAGLAHPCERCPLDVVFSTGKAAKYDFLFTACGKTFRVHCSPIHNGSNLIGYIHTAEDITQQSAMEKRIVHVQKMEAIATLAAGIAHDFNNILGAILGNTELLLYRLSKERDQIAASQLKKITTGEIRQHLGAVKTAGNRAKELVGQILAFSRQSNSQRLRISLSPVIKEAVKLLRATLPATIDLQANVSQDSAKVLADPTQVHQMLMDLVTNACQAFDTMQGSITVELGDLAVGGEERTLYPEIPPGAYVCLAVSDNGPGMSRETMTRMFDPFFSTKPLGESTGMGLSVLHGLLENNEGYIHVWSEPGKGSSFSLFFPRVESSDEHNLESVVAIPRGSGLILFVDDELEIVTVRSRMLEFLGYTVLSATRPEDAVNLFEEHRERIDLVITDQTMPGMSGLELASLLHEKRSDLPIILCSGYSEGVTDQQGQAAGIARFLAKPLDMRQMASAIRELLNRETVGHADSDN